MPLANCRKCGKLFRKVNLDICKDCEREEEELLLDVREFLRENPDAIRNEILDEFEMEQALLEKWIEQKRIVLVKESGADAKPTCPSCGREVKEGQTYCRTCMFKKLQQKGAAAKGEKAPEPAEKAEKRSGMHYRKE